MKATAPWITYRTRFLIKAKQLTTSLTFIDLLGRHQSGRKGDYLVESSEGVLSIAPRQIFEDIYVPLQAGGLSWKRLSVRSRRHRNTKLQPETKRRRRQQPGASAKLPHAPAPSDPQIPPTLSRPPHSQPRPSLPLSHLRSLQREDFTGH